MPTTVSVSSEKSPSVSVNCPSGSPRAESNPAEIITRSGLKRSAAGTSASRKGAENLGAARSGGKRIIHDESARFAFPDLRRRASARIPRMLMRVEEQDRTIVPEDFLGAVAVMHIPIDDQHALDPVIPPRVPRANRDVVEHAEAHSAIRGRVMSRRAHGAKRALCFSAHDCVNRRHHRTRRGQRGAKRSREISVSPVLSVRRPAAISVRTFFRYSDECTEQHVIVGGWLRCSYRQTALGCDRVNSV